MNNFLSNVFTSNDKLTILMNILLVLYISNISINIPNIICKISKNPIFKIFIFSLIIKRIQSNISQGLLISIAFFVTNNIYTNKNNINELFSNVEEEEEQIPLDSVDISSNEIEQKMGAMANIEYSELCSLLPDGQEKNDCYAEAETNKEILKSINKVDNVERMTNTEMDELSSEEHIEIENNQGRVAEIDYNSLCNILPNGKAKNDCLAAASENAKIAKSLDNPTPK
jgi:hypothetical protein